MNGANNSLRSAVGAQAATLADMSPLLGQWTSRVAHDPALSDEIFVALAEGGFDLSSWVGVRKVFTACVTVANLHDLPLTRFVPALGGVGNCGAEFTIALKDVLNHHLGDVIALSDRMLVANDPATGIEMWSAAQAQIPAGGELLVVGAGAGLELVADGLDERLTWRPAVRSGVDLHPIDVRDELSTRWLLAVCPPDDVMRAERTRQAIDLAKERAIKIVAGDAVEHLVTHSATNLVVMGASVLCMFDDPARFIEAARRRSGVTWLVSQEVVSVHRRSGLGAGLENRRPGDIVTRVVHWVKGSVRIVA